MRLRSLEAGRGIAAAMVLLTHATSMVGVERLHRAVVGGGVFDRIGTLAVYFFFVLSGFTIAWAHGPELGQARRIPAYLWRRVCRIYPLYWMVLAAKLPAVWVFAAPVQLAVWISLAPVPFSIAGDPIPVVWTLRNEIGFYLVFALFMLPRLGGVALALWAAASLLFSLPGVAPALTGNGAPLTTLFSHWNFVFITGMAAALVLRRLAAAPGLQRAATACALGGAGLIIACFLWLGLRPAPLLQVLLYPAGFGLLAFGVAALEQCGLVRLGRWAAWAGMLSYPLYLLHIACIDLATDLLLRLGNPAWLPDAAISVIFIAVALAGSLLGAVLLDQPVQDLLRMLRRTWPAGAREIRPLA